MKEINEIKSQIGQLQVKLSEAQKRLEDAGMRHIGLKCGDRIEVDGIGIVEVTGVAFPPFRVSPRPEGLKVKKNGRVGKQSAGYIGSNSWRKL